MPRSASSTPTMPSSKASIVENEAYRLWSEATPEVKRERLEILVELLRKHAFAVCCGKIPDKRQDFYWIANTAVWRAIARAKKFRGDSKFSTWFHRIVLNECNRFLKSTLVERGSVPLTEAPEGSGGQHPDLRHALREVAKTLSDSDNHLLERLKQGDSIREIATRFGITEGAAKVRVHRLRGKLKDAL